MNKKERTKRLRALMADHKLSAADVGNMIFRAPQTVRSWTCANEGRCIPTNTLALLELKLKGGSK